MEQQHVFTGQGAPDQGGEGGEAINPTKGAHYIDLNSGRHYVGISDGTGTFWAETLLFREYPAGAPQFTPQYPELLLVPGPTPAAYLTIGDGAGGWAWHRLALYSDIGSGS